MIVLNEVKVKYSVSLRHMYVTLFERSIYEYLNVVICINKYLFYLNIQSSNYKCLCYISPSCLRRSRPTGNSIYVEKDGGGIYFNTISMIKDRNMYSDTVA